MYVIQYKHKGADMTYSIYQIKSDLLRDYGFVGLDFTDKYLGGVCKEHYEKVYSGNIGDCEKTIEEKLELLFRMFNIEKPADYKGRSLSVSDVVVIGEDAYYCDSFGWSKIFFLGYEYD